MKHLPFCFTHKKIVRFIIVSILVIAAALSIYTFCIIKKYSFSSKKTSPGIPREQFSETDNSDLISDYRTLSDEGRRLFFDRLFSSKVIIFNNRIHAVFDDANKFYCADENNKGSVYNWKFLHDALIITLDSDEGYCPFSTTEMWTIDTDSTDYIFSSDKILFFTRFNGNEEIRLSAEY